jgi:glucose-6-phosphate 1-epimerase
MSVRLEAGLGGLQRAVVETVDAAGELYLQGAHVTQWNPQGTAPVLFMSKRSGYAAGRAIRGGVPVIFPWFGAREAGLPGPAHGFARSMMWSVGGTSESGVELVFEHTDATRALGFGGLQARFRAEFGKTLKMELEVRNTSDAALKYEEALHTYFSIADIHQVSVTGLEGTSYIDKTDAFKQKQQRSEPVRIAKETDQVHGPTDSVCVIHDPVWRRRMIVEKSCSRSTIVWNPWIEKTKGMSDMDPEDWRSMICVESGNAGAEAVRLAPGAAHTLTTVIRVEQDS